MPDFTDKTEPNITFDGSYSLGEIVEAHPGVPMVAKGKLAIKDIGKRLAQIRGLKPGSTSIRTDEMVEEMLTRLTDGETLTSILCDEHMPAKRTLDGWTERDEALNKAIIKAQASGQHVLADIRLDIAQRGRFSTGDARYDEMLIKAISANIAQRNRQDFGEHRHVEVTQTVSPVVLPSFAFGIEDASFTSVDDDEDDDEGE